MPSCYRNWSTIRSSGAGPSGPSGPWSRYVWATAENRGPSDHVRTIFYMSCATPEKRKEWPARHGSRPARPRPRSSLAHRDHGPDGPNGPEGRRSGFQVWEVKSRLSRRRLRDHLAATVPTTRGEPRRLRRTPGRRSTRAFRPGDPRLHELRFGQAAGSTRCGLGGAIFQPAVCRGCPPAPWSALVTAAVPGEPLDRLSTLPFGPLPHVGGQAMIGIIVRLSSACFRFRFD